jgi:hypothetical protein
MVTMELAYRLMSGETQGDGEESAERAPHYSGPDEPMVTICKCENRRGPQHQLQQQ